MSKSKRFEHATLIQLIKTDNKVLNKIVIAFAALCSECEFLINEGENKYFNAILYYGEGAVTSNTSESGDSQIQMGKFISCLQVNT